MDMIHFKCSSCGKKLKVDAAGAGKRVRCPGCGERVIVPVRRQEEAALFRAVFSSLVRESTLFHERMRSDFEKTGVPLGKVTLFEVRVYLLAQMQIMWTGSSQPEYLGSELMGFCYQLLWAEFHDEFPGVDLRKVVNSRSHDYFRVVREAKEGEAIGRRLLFNLHNMLMVSAGRREPQIGPFPLVIGNAMLSFQRRVALQAAEIDCQFSRTMQRILNDRAQEPPGGCGV